MHWNHKEYEIHYVQVIAIYITEKSRICTILYVGSFVLLSHM